MAHKQKGPTRTEARFVTDLPIDTCARRLEMLANPLTVDLHRRTSDSIDFIIRYKKQATANGKLRRWQGTLTRVDYDIEVHEGLTRWILFILVALSINLLVLPLLILNAAGIDGTLWLGLAGSFIALTVGVILLAEHFAPPSDVPVDIAAALEEALNP